MPWKMELLILQVDTGSLPPIWGLSNVPFPDAPIPPAPPSLPVDAQPSPDPARNSGLGAADNTSRSAANDSSAPPTPGPAPTQSSPENPPPRPARPAYPPQSQPKSGTDQSPNGIHGASPRKELRFEGNVGSESENGEAGKS
jgi:hypothetical protein